MKLKHLFENEVPKITDPAEAYSYTMKQGNRIPELEPVIMKDPWWAFYYAKHVIEDRWPEAEPSILHSTCADGYLQNFPEARKYSKDVPLMIDCYALMDVPNTINDEQLKKLFTLLSPTVNVLNHIHNVRVYDERLILSQLQQPHTKKINIRDMSEDENIEFLIYIGAINPNRQNDFT